MVWLAFAFMTVAAVLCVSWPLVRPRRDGVAGAGDVDFYRQQLAELDADVDRGVLGRLDVAATRVELGRRLIAADEHSGAALVAGQGRRVAAALAGVFVLAITAGLYARIGHPAEPDAPLAARVAGKSDFALAMAKIEAHLAADPDDGRGAEIIAPIYMRLGRFDDAARAFRNTIRVLGPTPDRQAALGQALVMASDGVVTAEARQTFDAALKDDPALPQARFFQGLAALQDGDKGRARTVWEALVAEAPPEAPYLGILRQRLAEVGGAPLAGPVTPGAVSSGAAPALSGPGARPGATEGAAAVASLPADQQRTAIHGMVDGLAARLARDGHDAEGWLRLVRAYRVLGEGDRAATALADARRAMAADPQGLGRLDQLARELGLEG